jgi:ADP-ribose pyrophosphatase YjhB (NUDIX family)
MKSFLSAGLVVVQNHKILLVHPRNASWWGTYSIPKGIVEPGESPWLTALRETQEETGLLMEKNETVGCVGQIDYPGTKKSVLIFLAYLEHPVFLDFEPNDEVDWVGFLTEEKAKPRILPQFKQLLEYIK